MQKIRINATPPGFAPEEIRKDWVGCEIPLATEEDLEVDHPSKARTGTENFEGYCVLREKAIIALRANNKHEAADFWASLPLGRYLVFKKDICTIV